MKKAIVAMLICFSVIVSALFMASYGWNSSPQIPQSSHIQNQTVRYMRQQSSINNTDTKHQSILRKQPQRRKCDYWAEKGLPKSGTTWLMQTLKLLQATIQNQTQNPTLFVHYHELFKKEHRHHMTTTRSNHRKYRVCYFVVFRDARDRLLSYAHHITKRSVKRGHISRNAIYQCKYPSIFA